MKDKGYVCMRTSLDGQFLHFDVSSKIWLDNDKFPQLGMRSWDDQDYYLFKPSFVVP